MKVQILTDQQGNIIATGPARPACAKTASTGAAMMPGPQQLVHEFEIDDEVIKQGWACIPARFCVDCAAGKLVDHGTGGPSTQKS